MLKHYAQGKADCALACFATYLQLPAYNQWVAPIKEADAHMKKDLANPDQPSTYMAEVVLPWLKGLGYHHLCLYANHPEIPVLVCGPPKAFTTMVTMSSPWMRTQGIQHMVIAEVEQKEIYKSDDGLMCQHSFEIKRTVFNPSKSIETGTLDQIEFFDFLFPITEFNPK